MSSKATGVDMSSKAMDRRLRRLSDLWEFAQSLKGAKWLGKVKDLETAASGQNAKGHGQDAEARATDMDVKDAYASTK
jgi:hypothetical protein